ncbi:transposase [Collimonas arenae]|uniref:transposase n=1 Tax=Collimonas arenae TaxID=279058 RepID=UPI00068C4C20|nr:transposase [Collimonas arenae]
MILRDDQWRRLEPLMLGKYGDSGAKGRDNRLFIDAVLWYVLGEKGGLWSKLPSKFGKWNTVYMRFKRWNESGIWQQLVEDIADDDELYGAIKKIADLGEYRKVSKVRKALRKTNREVYNSSFAQAPINEEVSSETDVSTLHWLSLVG